MARIFGKKWQKLQNFIRKFSLKSQEFYHKNLFFIDYFNLPKMSNMPDFLIKKFKEF